MRIGIIGAGRLGSLLARYFAKRHDVKVHDVRPAKSSASLAQACAQDVVIPCVPIGEFETAIKKMSPLLRPGSLVVDVCSVMEHPVRVMKKRLPRSIQLLATHPNFGPDSAAESMEGRKIIVSRVRVKGPLYPAFKRALREYGLVIVEMSPAAHDKKAAESLVLTHFIGRALIGLGSKTTGIDTEGYRRLLRILQTVQNDSWELFEDMNRYNAYAAPMRRRLLRVMKEIDRKVAR